MSNNEMEFCQNYVSLFLIILNYSNDDSQNQRIEEIERFRDEGLDIIEASNMSIEQKNTTKTAINSSHDKVIVDYLKKNVADKSPELFNGIIAKLDRLLRENPDFVRRLKMLMSSSNHKIALIDYYNNYKIAVQRLIDFDLTKKI